MTVKKMTAAASKAAIQAARVKAERELHLAAFGDAVGKAVDAANAASVAVTATLTEATVALAKQPAFKNMTVTTWDKHAKPVLKSQLDRLETVGSASKSVMLTGARNLGLATAHRISVGKVRLTQSDWNATVRGKLEAKGVLPKPVEGKAGKGRPAGKGKGNPVGKGSQKPTVGKAGPVKALQASDLVDVLRLAGMGEYSEQLAHMVLNEKVTVTKWLTAQAL